MNEIIKTSKTKKTDLNEGYGLVRICSQACKDGKYKIHCFYRNKENNLKVHVADFTDYFYYIEDCLNDLEKLESSGLIKIDKNCFVHNFDGNKLYKVFLYDSEVKSHINKTNAYNLDIQPEVKYLNENNNIVWSKNRHILFIDIEVWNPENTIPLPSNPEYPITSIVVYSSILDRFFIFAWHKMFENSVKNPEIKSDENKTFFMFDNEKTMLSFFTDFLSKLKPDIITGWYTDQFDIPYIIERSRKIDVYIERVSPIRKIHCFKRSDDSWEVIIYGLDHIDLIDIFKDLRFNPQNWKLATIAEEFLSEEEIFKEKQFTWRDWENNFAGFLSYAVRDVEILVAINKKISPFDVYFSVQEMTNLPRLSLAFHKSIVVESYIIKNFYSQYGFPYRKDHKPVEYKGALVMDPVEPGIHKDVVILDYTSLYPSIISTFNISPETFITSFSRCEEIGVDLETVTNLMKNSGVVFIDTGYSDDLIGRRYLFFGHQYKLGIFSQMTKDLFYYRKHLVELSSRNDISDDEKRRYKIQQSAIKIISNSAYGSLGSKHFRFYFPECAETITFLARQALITAIDFFSSCGFKVLYGDTDSIMVKGDKNSVEECLKTFNENLYDLFCKKFFVGDMTHREFCIINLKFEKDLERMFFPDSKKRYYGVIRGGEAKIVRGMNIIRKDAPKAIKPILNKLFEMCLYETISCEELDNVYKYIRSVPPHLIGIAKNFSKNFDMYTKMIPQHLRGVQIAHAIHNLDISHNDAVYMFYIKLKPGVVLNQPFTCDVICLRESDLDLLNNDIYEIDYDTFFEKQILGQLDEFSIVPTVKSVLDTYRAKNKQESNIYCSLFV